MNFTGSLPRRLLEQLAATVAERGLLERVPRVYDQYLEFVCIERNLFTALQCPTEQSAFEVINDNTSTEARINELLDSLANTLFCVLLTLGGQMPLLVASGVSGPAEALARRLERRLRDHMASTKGRTLSASSGTKASYAASELQRPIVHLLDRSFDLSAPLKHPSTYSALLHDLIGISANRIVLPTAKGASDKKTFDVDAKDVFWASNATLPFPSVTGTAHIGVDTLTIIINARESRRPAQRLQGRQGAGDA